MTALAFTIAHNVTGRTARARVIKLSSRNGTPAGLALPVGWRRCGRCYALTFHCSNGLLKPRNALRSLRDRGLPGSPGQSPSHAEFTPPSRGYIADQFCYLRGDIHHVADHDNRRRPDPLLSHHAFHSFQR